MMTQRESSKSPLMAHMSEPSSPMRDCDSPSRIDFDILLALNETHMDSECSSINASESGNSGVSQESGWERDDEFTWSVTPEATNTAITANDHTDCSQPSPQLSCDANTELIELNCKPKAELNDRNEKINNKEEIGDTWDESPKQTSSESNANEMTDTRQQSSRRLFGLVGIRKNNWEFPPFPINELNSTANDTSQTCIVCYSRQTQTESKDWALLELSQYDKSNEGLVTSANSINEGENLNETKMYANKSVSKVKLHKGTFTSDIPDALTKSQKLESLRFEFPKAEESHLIDILDACHEDYNWAFKLLSEFSDDHFEVSLMENVSLNNKEIHIELNDNKILPKADESEFVLTLDHNLAAILESSFGAVCNKASLNEDDLTVHLSHGVARLLHHHWKKSFNQKFSTQSFSKQSKESINHNHNLINRQKYKNVILEDDAPKTEFQEIMDFELAVSLSRKDYDDKLTSKLNALGSSPNPLAKELLSTKLKRGQLYLRYPGVDQGFLDEIFESNKYCLGKTVKVIDESLGEVADFSKETEALIAEETNNSPLSSRSTSPTKPIRKVIDTNSLLSEINGLLIKKKEYHDKAHVAYARKMFAVASYYGEEASKFSSDIQRLSREIVDNMLITCANSNEIDLHGLHVSEVNVILAEYLKRKSEDLSKHPSKRKLHVDIITGYGATKGVQGRIKPIVIQYLKQKNYMFEMVNMGVVRVFLTQQT